MKVAKILKITAWLLIVVSACKKNDANKNVNPSIDTTSLTFYVQKMAGTRTYQGTYHDVRWNGSVYIDTTFYHTNQEMRIDRLTDSALFIREFYINSSYVYTRSIYTFKENNEVYLLFQDQDSKFGPYSYVSYKQIMYFKADDSLVYRYHFYNGVDSTDEIRHSP